MIKVSNLKFNIGFSNTDIKKQLSLVLNVAEKDILSFIILKQSIDARRKPSVFYVLNLGVELISEKGFESLHFDYDDKGLHYTPVNCTLKNNPIIIGFGPSGMFLALALSQMGFKPIVVEQGAQVEKRVADVQEFWENKKLNMYSNVQFGEGGAGTFSDGKLNTNLSSPYCQKVINTFVEFGAPKEIAYLSKPHIGSDKLIDIVKNIRHKVIDNGGQILFNTKLINVEVINNVVSAVVLQNVETNENFKIETQHLFLAIGHSAISTYKMLKNLHCNMQQKPFAMGVRIEQKQIDINISQYGKNNKLLPSADYKLVTHLDNGRSVFTFCMCPGGVVVNSSSEENTIVTNGMSYFKRDKENANSALLVNVTPQDFESDDVLAGLNFQRKYEKLAFEIAGSDYSCPAESVGSFLTDKPFPINVKPSTTTTMCKLKMCLPNFVYDSLKMAIPKLNNQLKNFGNEGNLLIGIESRSSSPVTIVRNQFNESNIVGLFPVGEGAGYAGGIISSAVDGIKTAEKFLEKLKVCE